MLRVCENILKPDIFQTSEEEFYSICTENEQRIKMLEKPLGGNLQRLPN